MENNEDALLKNDDKYCKRCHRKLKDERSRELGYGKICYQKYLTTRVTYLFDMNLQKKEEN